MGCAVSSPRQHTPGPWRTSAPESESLPANRCGGFDIRITAANGLGRVTLAAVHDIQANALLIASAPELLAACMSALRALEDNLQPGPMDADAKAGLRAAIAKATGGAA